MPYDYRIVDGQNLLLIVGSATITSADIYRVVTTFQKDPNWRPTMNMLVDWRLVDAVMIDLDEVKKLAATALELPMEDVSTPLGPRAAVVLSDHGHETIPLLYAGFLRDSGLETRIFYRMDQAAEWLGADLDAIP